MRRLTHDRRQPRFWARVARLALTAGLAFAAVSVAPRVAAQAVLTPTVAAFVTVNQAVVALEHVRVIDGTGAAPREDQTVVITDGTITALGASGRVRIPRAAQRLNLTGKTVIPGLVGMHEHLFYPTGPEGLTFVPQPFSFPRLYLAGGVTTARTGGTFDTQADLDLKREIDDDRVPGPTVLVTAGYLDAPRLASPQLISIRTPAEARGFVEYWASRGAHSFKAYTGLSRAALAEAITAAHERGLTVTGHLCSVTFREAAELGIDNLEHGFLVASDWVTNKRPNNCPRNQSRAFNDLDVRDARVQDLIRLLVERRIAITSTLAVTELPAVESSFREALAPAIFRIYVERREGLGGLGHVTYPDTRKEMTLERAFVDAGGLLVAGADPTGDGQVLPGTGDQRNVEMLVEAGFSPLEAIRIATFNGARFLKLDARIGSVEVGKEADLVVLDGNPAARIQDIRRVVTVFKRGVGYDSTKLIESVRGHVGVN